MTILHIFLVGGQSNAVIPGVGDALLSPLPADCVFVWNGTVSHLGRDGSAWPQFGITYNTIRREQVMLVPCAVGGSSQVAAADQGSGNWDTSGTLAGVAITQLMNSISGAVSAGYTPDFHGVLWCQGEMDAIKIRSGVITANDYKLAFSSMSSVFRQATYPTMPMYVFRTGTDPDGGDTGFFDVRQAQEQICESDPYTRIVFRDAVDYPQKVWANGVHYTQPGYNWMGKSGAINVLSGLNPTL